VHADDITPTSRECSAVLDNVENIYRYVRSYLRDFKERKENKMEETFERVTERHAERDEDKRAWQMPGTCEPKHDAEYTHITMKEAIDNYDTAHPRA